MALPLLPTMGVTGVPQRSPTGVRYRYTPPIIPGWGTALAVYDGRLFCGGQFIRAGQVAARNIASWDGSLWYPVTTGVNAPASVLHVWDDKLLVAGNGLDDAGGVVVEDVATWNAASWAAMHWLGNGPQDFATYAGDLYMVGNGASVSQVGRYVKRWTGSEWEAIVTNATSGLHACVSYGGDLIVGGISGSIAGESFTAFVRYDGSDWHAMPLSGIDSGYALALHILGGELYAAGLFIQSGESAFAAKWSGSAWSIIPKGSASFGSGICLGEYDGKLVVGGSIGYLGHVAMLDGTTWVPLGVGLNNQCVSLAAYGDKLIATGEITSAGGVPVRGIAQWDGAAWSAMGKGLQR